MQIGPLRVLCIPVCLQVCAVQGLRGALAQWLREACMQQSGAVMLRIAAAQPGSTSGTVPTLLLIRDMLHQVILLGVRILCCQPIDLDPLNGLQGFE